jgi:ABC-type transport system substrate-binding protein
MTRWRLALAAIGLAAVAGVVALLAHRPAPREIVIFGGSDDPGTLDPQGIDWGEQARITWSLFETLVKFGPDDARLEPGLALEWTEADGGRAWTLALRPGVKFHDGTEFNAEAVVLAFERFRPGHPLAPPVAYYAHYYEGIESIEAIDPTHVRFRLKGPNALFLKNLAMFPAAIPSPAALRAAGPEAFGRAPVGTGPYRLKEWRPKEKIVLERFPDYWGTPAPLPSIAVLPIPDSAVRVQRLLDGEIDIMDNVSPSDLDRLEADPRVKVGYAVSMNIGYLGFNEKLHPYNHPDFRRAVAHAIDKRRLVAGPAFFGRAEPAVSIVPPSIEGHDPNVPEPAYDPAEARRLLAKVPDLPATVELWHMAFSRPYFPDPDKVAQMIRQDLEAIGLKVRLSSFPRDAYSVRTHEETHPMILLGWSTDNADADNFLYPLLHRDAIGGTNVVFFDDPEFNETTRRQQTELDPAARLELIRRAQRIYKERLPSIPLVHVRQAVAFRARLDFTLHPIETRLYTIRQLPP